MAAEPRMTIQVGQVLKMLYMSVKDVYGLEIMQQTGLQSGTVYPILARLEAAGWVTVREERCNPREEGRPIRKFYKITEEGMRALGRTSDDPPSGAAVFAATEAIRSGAWDRYLDTLSLRIRARLRAIERG